MRMLLLLSAIATAAPAIAQDMPGVVDLGAMARGQVQRGTMDGHAERDAGQKASQSGGNALTPRSRAYCDAFPSYRQQFGAADPRVTKLAAACRRAGYPY
jgi:hypothetical protein